MTIYQSHFPPVQQWSNLGVFDFLFTKNPKLRPNHVALIDATTGDKVRLIRSRSSCGRAGRAGEAATNQVLKPYRLPTPN